MLSSSSVTERGAIEFPDQVSVNRRCGEENPDDALCVSWLGGTALLSRWNGHKAVSATRRTVEHRDTENYTPLWETFAAANHRKSISAFQNDGSVNVNVNVTSKSNWVLLVFVACIAFPNKSLS
jgi:hypothetical protein